MDIPSIVSKAFESRFKQRQPNSGKPGKHENQSGESRQESSDISPTTLAYEIDNTDLLALNQVIESLNLIIVLDTELSDNAQLLELSSGKLIKSVSSEYVVNLCNRLRTDGAEYFQASGFLLSEVV